MPPLASTRLGQAWAGRPSADEALRPTPNWGSSLAGGIIVAYSLHLGLHTRSRRASVCSLAIDCYGVMSRTDREEEITISCLAERDLWACRCAHRQDTDSLVHVFSNDYVDTLALFANTAAKILRVQPTLVAATAPCRTGGPRARGAAQLVRRAAAMRAVSERCRGPTKSVAPGS